MSYRAALPSVFAVLIACLSTVVVSGCASSIRVDDPSAELNDPGALPARQRAAMKTLDEASPNDPQYLEILHGMVWRPGYTIPVRKEAVLRLEQRDPDGLKRTIRQRMPRLTSMAWLSELCSMIADRGWDDLTPALASSWARPTPLNPDETQRPEYQALAALHGEAEIPDIIFQLFMESKSVAEQGLRTRCWDLMHRLGHRDRLVQLVTATQPPADDAMLIDLHAGASQLGIVPHNREEILWLRKLREPSRSAYWSEAVSAMQQLPPARRSSLELRDLAVVIAAARHAPDLLEQSESQLYGRLADYLRTQRHHAPSGNYGNLRGVDAERLRSHRDVLSWGDLAAMLLAVRAFEVPQMVDHLFAYADRDMEDKSTEYGGVISLDERGRFEILEFLPVIRRHDHEFIASQAMMDAGYTSLFHFHYHAQRYRNADHAGPGLGDLNYADSTRANCLVFTFINRDTMNMDFYRQGRIVVDLGEVRRR